MGRAVPGPTKARPEGPLQDPGQGKQGQPLIYICIPTHNEQQTVGVVLWKLRQVLTEFHRDYQLLVADDASTDKTTDVLEPYTRVLPLTVIRTEQRQGYAASLEMLLREAVRRSEYPKRDVIVTLQADFSEEPDDVVGLIKRMEAGADLAVGIKVGNQKDSRTRRLARSLSHFFARKQTWPEGVITPFDGYRAYRLHAVKRAIEERAGRRLLHFDGWAGHAELLRAVLPHARRIDTLNVEDRPDRLQRPRREKPFAAAWQVRAMASGAEPGGLASVEELDSIVASSSRSREAAARAAADQPRRNGSHERRPQGQAQRGGRDGRTERSPRTAASAESRSRTDRVEGGRPDRDRPERSAGQGQKNRPPKRTAAAAAGGDPRKRPKPTADAPAPDASVPDATAPDATAPDATAMDAGAVAPAASGPKKRRRRRRGKGAASTGTPLRDDATTEAVGVGQDIEASEPPADAQESDAGTTGESETGEQPKRRRRGGRRGGRGRRRGPRTDAADNGSGAGNGPDGSVASDDRADGDGDGPRSGVPVTPPEPLFLPRPTPSAGQERTTSGGSDAPSHTADVPRGTTPADAPSQGVDAPHDNAAVDRD
jgi:hypothetical protein